MTTHKHLEEVDLSTLSPTELRERLARRDEHPAEVIRAEREREAQRRLDQKMVKEVVLHTVSDREFVATLVEIKNFGFAYRFRDAEDIMFAPWSVLRWMRLAGEET